MAVLGLDDDAVEAACRRAEGDAWVANFNAPGQVDHRRVDAEALSRVGAIAKELGAKRVLSIPVGGAFHTPLMAPARDRLRKASPRPPSMPPTRSSSPTWTPERTPSPTSGQLLSAQLCSPVRWRQTLDTLLPSGAQTFVELGPGGVLTGLSRRVPADDDAIASSVSTPDDLDHLRRDRSRSGVARRAAPTGERFHMTERLVVSPAAGLFEPAAGLAGLSPRCRRKHSRSHGR